ncbi:unnamed protein product [Ceutorhynchus assimilis]|uniref:C2H2-type domain-containing protein n=1 Tax=Ceutorhynchus assimilis TaxID=467358 RepID=A0A9N9QRM2_9CUCU|nr:unnamed protein product [Ceutorhynchus assimilis]
MDLPSDLQRWIQLACREFGVEKIQQVMQPEYYKENPTEFVELRALKSYSQINEEFGSSYRSYPLPLDSSDLLPVGTISCVRPIAQYCNQAVSGTSYKLQANPYSYEKRLQAQSNHQYVPGDAAMNDRPINQHCDLNTSQIVRSSSNISQTVSSQSIHGGTYNQVSEGPLLTENSMLRVPVPGNSCATMSVVQNSTRTRHYCPFCKKEFPQRRALIEHNSTFSHQNNVEKSAGAPGSSSHCKICDRIFTSRGYLIQHINAHHSNKAFKCRKCGKRFFTKEDLDTHAEKHYDSKKRLMCQYCPKTFNYTSDLSRHQSLHTGRGLLKCSCGKLFVRRDHMARHALHCLGK